MVNPVKIVSFDSTGTLLHLTKQPGQLYLDAYLYFFRGSRLPDSPEKVAAELNSNFLRCYQSQSKIYPNFGYGSISSFEWWGTLVRDAFKNSSFQITEEKFKPFFLELYNDFGSIKYWRCYPDVKKVLWDLNERCIKCVVISDFDERLPIILQGHNLLGEKGLSSVYVSYLGGCTKPGLMKHAISCEGFSPQNWVHVGDSLVRDVDAAIISGMTPMFLNREGKFAENEVLADVSVIRSLDELLAHIT